ncbi:hypothetical protein ACVWWN_005901 [Mycobacterium sp. URHB0021]|jgi:hypothetical protein
MLPEFARKQTSVATDGTVTCMQFRSGTAFMTTSEDVAWPECSTTPASTASCAPIRMDIVATTLLGRLKQSTGRYEMR